MFVFLVRISVLVHQETVYCIFVMYRVEITAPQGCTLLIQLVWNVHQLIDYAILCDNQVVIHLVENLFFHARTKHVEVHYHLGQISNSSCFFLFACNCSGTLIPGSINIIPFWLIKKLYQRNGTIWWHWEELYSTEGSVKYTLTKGLSGPKFEKFRRQLSLILRFASREKVSEGEYWSSTNLVESCFNFKTWKTL